MALDSGIPMSTLVEEPQDYLDAMFEVRARRIEQQQNPDSELWEE